MRAPLAASLLAECSASTGGHVEQHADHALGVVSFPIGCSAEAQGEFNQAVALLHHMTYPQAREAFERVAGIDPRCAMAHWGVAMTLFQPLWPTRPSPDALRRGWDAVQKAKALRPAAERERLFIAAADAFFRALWTAFRDGLSRADVGAALGLVVEGQRDRYRTALQALAPDLATIAGGLSDMTVLSFGEHLVEGVVTRIRDGVTHLHFVYFMRDDDGIWKIVEI